MKDRINDRWEEGACMNCGCPLYIRDTVYVDSEDWNFYACSPDCLDKLMGKPNVVQRAIKSI